MNYYEYILDPWNIFVALFSGYTVYYLTEVVKRPYLAAKDGPFKKFLMANVPTCGDRFWPTFWCVESRAHTIFANILRQNAIARINYRREVLSLKDGGEVALDWLEDNCAKDAPIIVILPGLTGESQAEYVKFLVTGANKNWNSNCRVQQSRPWNTTQGMAIKFYHLGLTKFPLSIYRHRDYIAPRTAKIYVKLLHMCAETIRGLKLVRQEYHSVD